MLDALAKVLQSLPLSSNEDLPLFPLGVPLYADHLRGGSGGEESQLLRDQVLVGGQVDQLHLGEVKGKKVKGKKVKSKKVKVKR